MVCISLLDWVHKARIPAVSSPKADNHTKEDVSTLILKHRHTAGLGQFAVYHALIKAIKLFLSLSDAIFSLSITS